MTILTLLMVKKKVVDEEITSEEDEGLDNDEFSEDQESPEEARIRMAKELVEQAREEMDDEEIEGMLTMKTVKHIQMKNKGMFNSVVADTLQVGDVGFLRGHLMGVNDVAVMTDGRAVTGSNDCCLIVWDLCNMRKISVLKGFRRDKQQTGHSASVLAVAVSDDNKYIASGGKDRGIRIWSAHDYSLKGVLKGHKDLVTSLVFFKHSHNLFSGSYDRCIKQ